MAKAVNPFTENLCVEYPVADFHPFGEGHIPKLGDVYKCSEGIIWKVTLVESDHDYVRIATAGFWGYFSNDFRYVKYKNSIERTTYALMEPKQYIKRFFNLLGGTIK